MNTQEREQLTRFLSQLSDARVGEKNADADALIRETVAKQPDAAYLLVQRAMLLEQALNSAKTQIAQLQSQVQASQAGGNGSFLGKSNPWSLPSNAQPQSAVPGANDYQLPRSAGSFTNPMSGGGASSFLGSVATTAAGVVAGSFLFQGIENLLGHHQSSSNWMGSAQEPVSETVINNYYDTNRDDAWQPQDQSDDFLASNGDDDFQYDADDSDWV